MKFSDFKCLTERRNELMKNINYKTDPEIKEINKKLKELEHINSNVDITKFVDTLSQFTNKQTDCNLVEIVLINNLHYVQIVNDDKCVDVLSYFPGNKKTDISFLWNKGINNGMDSLLEKYEELNEMLWKLFKRELQLQRKNSNYANCMIEF